ncbi:MAG: hypothetical protein JWP97_5322 [Labilithrix sp.]|nr:hypothetical protein [Labilithrix sp.]
MLVPRVAPRNARDLGGHGVRALTGAARALTPKSFGSLTVRA